MQRMKRLRVGSSFVGWPTIDKLFESADNERLKLLVLVLFKTGGRISEVLSLTKSNFHFDYSKYSVVVSEMPVLKKYRMQRDKYNRPIKGSSERILTYREFPFPKSEKYSDVLEKMILERKHKNLFHNYMSVKQLIRRQDAYKYVRKLGEECGIRIHNHWWRNMRNAQLKVEYRLVGNPLNEWMGWSKREKGTERQEQYGKLGWYGLELEIFDGMLRRKKVIDMLES